MDYVYVILERRGEKETRYQLAAVARGPYRVVETNSRTVTIRKKNINFQRLSSSRLVVAPALQTLKELRAVVHPIMDD